MSSRLPGSSAGRMIPAAIEPFQWALHVPGRDEAGHEPSPVSDVHRLPLLHEIHVDAGVLPQFADADAADGLVPPGPPPGRWPRPWLVSLTGLR